MKTFFFFLNVDGMGTRHTVRTNVSPIPAAVTDGLTNATHSLRYGVE